MDVWRAQPVICEINAAIWFTKLKQKYGTSLTLGNLPDEEIQYLKKFRFDGVWLMGVWQRSPEGRRVAREHPGLQDAYRQALPDYRAEDVVGSPYAICRFSLDPMFGSDNDLAQFRARLRENGMRLILDFVPNHLARDHNWVFEFPQRFVRGSESDLRNRPADYFEVSGQVFAHGRDPNFPGWTDTVQLDYRVADTRRAMTELLGNLAQKCDGLRCDMAMLVTESVFRRTWGGTFEQPARDFWPDAISSLKKQNPDFLMLAEAYWGLEYELQQQGFDYTYDGHLYQTLRQGQVGEVRRDLSANAEYQRHLARYIENHDEPAAIQVFGEERSKAAATVAFGAQGLRLVHAGQIDGAPVRVPVQLSRAPEYRPNLGLENFYKELLTAFSADAFHNGSWRLLETAEAWSGNPSHSQILAQRWTYEKHSYLVLANLAPYNSQAYVLLQDSQLPGHMWELRDLLSSDRYEREGDDMTRRGLYVDLSPWGRNIFEFQQIAVRH